MSYVIIYLYVLYTLYPPVFNAWPKTLTTLCNVLKVYTLPIILRVHALLMTKTQGESTWWEHLHIYLFVYVMLSSWHTIHLCDLCTRASICYLRYAHIIASCNESLLLPTKSCLFFDFLFFTLLSRAMCHRLVLIKHETVMTNVVILFSCVLFFLYFYLQRFD